MIKINYPVCCFRDFWNDFKIKDHERIQTAAAAALSLLSLYRPFLGPLSVIMSSVRSVVEVKSIGELVERKEYKEAAFHYVAAVFSTAAVALFFFRPVLCFFTSSVCDLLLNARALIEHLKASDVQKALESLSFMTLDVLFIASFCYGAVEVVVACKAVQIFLDVYLAAKHFYHRRYFEGVCQSIVGGFHAVRGLPQFRLLQWKYQAHPPYTAVLRQDAKGFVYLDVPDETLQSLRAHCTGAHVKEPPYFKPGMAGAHVSVMLPGEVAHLRAEDIGRTFSLRYVHVDSVNRYHFVALNSPELEQLRASYRLAPRLHGDHDFHLTFGKEAV